MLVLTPKPDGFPQWYGALEAALRREIKEEVNVEVGKIQYLLDLTFISPDGTPVLVLSYYAPYVSGEVTLDEDAVEYKWATLAELKELDLIAGISEEIEMVDALLRK
jgi:NADH pyrophosphatase NudC (nudix superfamily)